MSFSIPTPRQGARRIAWLASTAFTSILLPLCLAPAVAQETSSTTDEAVTIPKVDVTTTRLVPARSTTTPAPARQGGTQTGPRGPAPTTGPSTGTPSTGESTGTSISGVVSGTVLTGASTTIISSADIERSPGATLQDLLAREPGIQISNVFGAVNGASTTVDMRGFGATGTQNALVMINGRRLNDIDLSGIDFSAIPRNSIERVEITRGNSGAVLYGDGAVGGVINIITKTGIDLPTRFSAQGVVGSYGYREGNASVQGSQGNWSGSIYGVGIESDGYRQNNKFRQSSGTADFRWTDRMGMNAYLNLSADDQHLGLPGGVRVTPTLDLFALNPRMTTTPRDFADKQGLNATGGVTSDVINGTQVTFDGGVRQKRQTAAFFCTGCPDFDSGFKATLTQFSVTPRISSLHNIVGMSGKLVAGIDYYDTIYGSDRSRELNEAPIHRYDLTQRTAAVYFMETLGVLPTTDVSFGARYQNNNTTARDRVDFNAPGAFFPVEGLPFDGSERQWAGHIGFEHRFNSFIAVFGRAAHSFRLPTVDERVGSSPFGVATNFSLKTQTSNDIEGGVRLTLGSIVAQSSVYDMKLRNELFFSPATFTNLNLDPTHRYGIENIVAWQATEQVRFKASLAYTRSVFREGPFAGNDVPLVSPWTGSGGVSWDVFGKYLVFDGTARFFSDKRMDNDSANRQLLIPGHTLVDVRLGGQYQQFNWSVSVQNLFDKRYFEYAISSLDFFTGLPNFGTYNAYPLPGRVVQLKGGVTF
jgi:iron complex outermembrane recepter protein